jgi:hypothetical protein
MKLLPASEHQLQASLCEYLAHALRPDCYVYAVPNGGARHIRVAVKLKAEGVRRGVPDLHIMMPGARLVYLEMKIKGGSLSPDQKAFRDLARSLGFEWGMAKTLDEAIEFLATVGALRNYPREEANQAKEKASGT